MENVPSFSFATDAVFACISFFPAGLLKLGIRNNCNKCMIAVVNWQPAVGVKTYSIGAYNQIIIEMESSSVQLIGEQPCN